MTARNANSARDLSETVVGRLMALAKAHDLIRSAVTLESTLSESSSLRDLVGATLDPHLPAGTDQLRIIGPDLTLGRNATTSLALVLLQLQYQAVCLGLVSPQAPASQKERRGFPQRAVIHPTFPRASSPREAPCGHTEPSGKRWQGPARQSGKISGKLRSHC